MLVEALWWLLVCEEFEELAWVVVCWRCFDWEELVETVGCLLVGEELAEVVS